MTSYSENGISISDLVETASKISIEIEPYKIEFDELISLNITFPCISIIKIDNLLHYIIIKKIKHDSIEIYDSINGKRVIKLSIFKQMYSNIILFTKRTQEKQCDNKLIKVFKWPFKIYFGFIFLVIFLSLITVTLNFFLSLINKYIFSYIQNLDWIQTSKTIIFLFWISIAILLSNLISNLCLNFIRLKIVKKLKKDFISKLDDAQHQQINKIEQNEILLRYLSINLVSNFYASIIFFCPSIIFTLAYLIPFILFVNFKSISIIILTNAIKLLLTYLINLRIYFSSKQLITNNLNEINELTFLSKNNEPYGKKIWKYFSVLNYNDNINFGISIEQKINKLNIIKNSLFSLMTIISNTFIFLIFANVKNSNISEILFVFQIQSLLNEPLNNLQIFLTEKKINKINVERLFFVLDIPTIDNNNKLCLKEDLESIKIKNLSFGYSSKKIISNLNLVIDSNFVFEGKNGTGKTTLLKILSGSFPNVKNFVFLNDIPIEEIENDWIMNNIFMINKDNNFPNVDLYTYLFFKIPDNEKEMILKDQNFIDLLNELNVDLFANLFMLKNKLSMGQIQIIKLLPLMIKKFQLILLDESLEFIAKDLLENIKNLILKKQKTSIIIEVSHTNTFITNNHKIYKFS
ncbi:ABC-type bacteriocin/lantibiotic exporter with double-glycine peptidase domain [Metamycoplasma auris]|uniref:ABC-type bacteriocin/lantibiotic exporter with double-glycine peptidase domain n=2 Tax=Metamycoplasma auris TaxID=51363 RepID=A0A2W7HZC7_9BACT|nr:ABC-type bacteriocin/lantibiotic exporter with double-glycine peptidase domain [Metamycoplasma auris]